MNRDSFKMPNQPSQKRKGGAEKLRDKKAKSLEADAAKCRKLTDLFSSSSSGAAGHAHDELGSTSKVSAGAAAAAPAESHAGEIVEEDSIAECEPSARKIFASEPVSTEPETELEVEATLPQKRPRKKKIMPGEIAHDETLTDAERAYKVEVHNQIMDTVIESLHRRFLTHGTLYADFALLDTRNFRHVRAGASGLPQSALQELSKCLLKFDSRATVENLQCELKSLAAQWERLKTSALEEYTLRIVSETPEDGPEADGKEDEVEMRNERCSSCKDCAVCCYQIIRRYNLLTDAYHIIGLGYKFLLTMSITQVACERSFSTLKYIKSRLRSTLSQEHLEAFMLLATEKDILMALGTDVMIDRVAERSELLRKLLTH